MMIYRCIPLLWSQAQAFGYQIRADGRSIVQGHLFETEARYKKECPNEVIASAKTVYGQECEA